MWRTNLSSFSDHTSISLRYLSFFYIQLIIFNAGELSDKLILVSYRERTFLSYYPYLWIIVFHSSVRNVLFLNCCVVAFVSD